MEGITETPMMPLQKAMKPKMIMKMKKVHLREEEEEAVVVVDSVVVAEYVAVS